MGRLKIRGGACGLRGKITVPGDKSVSHRAIILGALSEGITEVSGCLRSEDCHRTLEAARAMGIEVEEGEELLRFYGKGLHGLREAGDILDCGNSGTTIRLLTGMLAGQPFLSILTGDASLRRRPMDRIILPLRRMGAEIWGRAQDTLPPLGVRGGQLQGLRYHTPVASAQVKSAILLAGLFAKGPTTVIEPFRSRDHTERMLSACGQQVETAGREVTLAPTGSLRASRISVPGDFSSAAFFILAALILPDSDLIIEGVGVNPTRTGLLDVLEAMGGVVEVQPEEESAGEPRARLCVRTSRLKGVSIGGEMIPRLIDEIPVLAVAAACAEGKTVIRDAAELRIKESDRIRAIVTALERMEIRVEELEDGLVIYGRGRLRGASCDSHGDHRMGMALTVAGLRADTETTVLDTACIQTSFPGFVQTLQHLLPGAVEQER